MALKRETKLPVPAVMKKKKTPKKVENPLFEKRPKQFGIGGALPPKKDLQKFVKWPKYVRLQRQRRVLNQRLKVPLALNQSTKTLDKNLVSSLFKMLIKYKPEGKATKKEHHFEEGPGRNRGQDLLKGKVQLVVIAHDLDPIEVVIWLPDLCKKMVKKEDKLEFSKIVEATKANFNDRLDALRRQWGGGIMGVKSHANTKAKEKILAKEATRRMS
ncbi:hypothetical protein GOP47_0016547 [Adiantum capillus-veneris]|uniref:60S ribosomal protein L7a n=1 Tax=Adiantum capillus-veneris TaxID=13818 RepID=A0A9D4UIC1_ADICA|nr:hypothetical protein GOP47_0016547 [Adiantum capillus-veneris]